MKINQLKLNVSLKTLDPALSGIDRAWALKLIHEKNAGKNLRNPWASRQQGGIAATTGAWLLASVPTSRRKLTLLLRVETHADQCAVSRSRRAVPSEAQAQEDPEWLFNR